MIKYAIWDKVSPIITPVGNVYTAEQWIEKYPVAALDSITVLCAAGEINGALFGTLGQMVDSYKAQGADFSNATTPEEQLAIIHAFDEAKEAAAKEAAENIKANEELTATSLASIAASMEFQNMMALEDVEV